MLMFEQIKIDLQKPNVCFQTTASFLAKRLFLIIIIEGNFSFYVFMDHRHTVNV